MATINTMITCDHCSSKIRIRAGVGYSKRQPFSFACKKCGTIVKVTLIVDNGNTKFEFTNASEEPLELTTADFLVEFHEDFLLTNEPANNIDPNTKKLIPKPSPYMMARLLMGAKFPEFAANMSLFLQNQMEFKNKLFRINNFYINDRVLEFKKESENLISSESKVETYKSLTQLNEMYFIPILKKDMINSNCSLFKNKILDILTSKKNILLDFIEELEELNFLKNQLKENLALMERFDELFFEIKPIINLNYIQSMDTDNLTFSIYSFNKIKQFYIDLFECIGREINFLIGLRNIEFNGNHNKLNLSNFSRVRDYRDCMLSSNGNKKEYLKDSSYFSLVEDVFDHKLRNGLGHYKCCYNPSSKNVEYYPRTDDLSKSRKETISYVNFVLKIYNLFNLLITLMYLKTVLYTVYFANKSELSLGLKDISLLVFNRFPPSFKNVDLIVNDRPPMVCLTYFWNGSAYNRPEILRHDFNYWNFNSLYEKFGFCDNDSTCVDIKLGDEIIDVIINNIKIFKFKIYENIEWYNIFMKMGDYSLIKRRVRTEIPYFNILPHFLNLLNNQ